MLLAFLVLVVSYSYVPQVLAALLGLELVYLLYAAEVQSQLLYSLLVLVLVLTLVLQLVVYQLAVFQSMPLLQLLSTPCLAVMELIDSLTLKPVLVLVLVAGWSLDFKGILSYSSYRLYLLGELLSYSLVYLYLDVAELACPKLNVVCWIYLGDSTYLFIFNLFIFTLLLLLLLLLTVLIVLVLTVLLLQLQLSVLIALL